MLVKNLLSPGNLSMGIKLRTEAAKAISHCEVVASKSPGGTVDTAVTLEAFFLDCAAKLAALKP